MRRPPVFGLARLKLGQSRTVRPCCAVSARELHHAAIYQAFSLGARGEIAIGVPKNPVDGLGLFVKFPARLTDLEQQA